MKEQKEDRRIRRTQKLLKESLADLMMEKSFKDISVKDITERADLNRGTFYLHYADTYDLLKKMETDILNDFQDMIDLNKNSFKEDTLLPVLMPVVNYIAENAEICKILFENSSSNDFVNEFHKLIHKNGLSFIKEQYPDANPEVCRYFFEFVTYGLTGIIKEWIDSKMDQPKEIIADIANKGILAMAHGMLGITAR